MRNLKTKLLAATVLMGVASPACAQIAFPTVQLDGVGASTPGDINQKVMHCIGIHVLLGKNDGTTSTVVPADYSPTTPTTGNPSLSCSTGDAIYNGGNTFTGTYISTGSGFGIQQWRNFTNNFDGTATNQPPAAAPFGIKPNYQYAFSEAALTPADITDYNTDDTEISTAGNFNNGGMGTDIDVSALANAGPAIQIPLYVVPIAFAYNQSYGVNALNQAMNFNNKYPIVINGVNAGGIRLTKSDYCAIWNGQITNWNDPAILSRNGKQPLYDPITDNATRWAAEGAPIRLIGRADKSGATSVFTRAMAAQCNGMGYTNRFLNWAESLPFDPSGTIDITTIRSDTNYKPGTYTAQKYAGTAQSLSGFAFDKNGASCDLSAGPGNASGGVCTVIATFGTQVGTGKHLTTDGLFAVADGSGNVEKAIKANTGTALVVMASGVKLDGKFGYIGADFTSPTPGRVLFATQIQVGTGATFAMPTAANAVAAFGTAILPPQTTATSGAYNTGDTRVVYKDLSDLSQGTEPVDRANPLHWVNVLYPPTGATLANPAKGYPVVGTTNLLTYTCFSSQAKVHGIANFVQYLTGKVTKKNAAGGSPSSITLSANTFPSTAAANLGILAKANIATVPAAWRAAYVETFFKKSTQNSGGLLGARNLWIQSAQATTNITETATGAGAAATNLPVIDNGAGGPFGPRDNRNPQCVQGGVADNVSPSLPGA
jgi:ABC-type phosphate transport system substrate-binding protein